MTDMKQNRTGYGTLLVLCASILFATGGAVLKLIPWSALAINGARNLIAAIVLAAYMAYTKHQIHFNKTVLTGAVSFIGVTSLFVIANKMTTAANAIILQYTCPVWIIIIMSLLFHEKPNRRDVLTVMTVFAGILCFFYDSLQTGHIAGDLIAVLSGIFYAGVFMLNTFEDGDAFSSILIGEAVSGILFTPLLIRETVFTPVIWTAVIFLGVFQVAAAYICLAIGTRYTSAIAASIIGSIEPILSPVLVAVIWHEILPPVSLIGAAIVIIAVAVYNILKHNDDKRK